MLGVLPEFADQCVVKVVGVGAQRCITFEDNHRRTVRIELVKHSPGVFCRLQGRRIRGAKGNVVLFADLLQLRYGDIGDGGQAHPEEQDRHRKPANRVWHKGTPDVILTHADFTMQ